MAQEEFFRFVIYLLIAFVYGLLYIAIPTVERTYLGILVLLGVSTMIFLDWHLDATFLLLILVFGWLWFGTLYGPLFGVKKYESDTHWFGWPNFWTKRILKPAGESGKVSTHVDPVASRTRASKKTY